MHINVGANIEPRYWDDKAQRVVRHPLERQYNIRIGKARLNAEAVLLELDGSEPFGLVRDRLKAAVMGIEPADDKPRLMEQLHRFALQHPHTRTKELYLSTERRIRAFDAACESITLDDVTHDWLVRFDNFMAQTAKSANSRSIHMRNLRAVFNDAIARELTTNYPFKRYTIKSQPTEHRALPVEALREFIAMDVLPYERKYKDMFVLMFLLCGISPVDLCALECIDHGRVMTRRAKTGQPIDIKVEPEAMEIIERYRGKGDKLLDILDGCGAHYLEWVRRMDRNLKTLGGVTMERKTAKDGKARLAAVKRKRWPKLSAYWARHTWATIAASLDIPMETIAQAMGHSPKGVTSIYVAFDRGKVDDANRRVIDWVFYGRR